MYKTDNFARTTEAINRNEKEIKIDGNIKVTSQALGYTLKKKNK